jgi:non-ribosomal peptide synthetase component F
VPAGLAGRLRDLAAARRCTLFTVLLTGWAILLYRHAGQARFAVGTVTSGRERMEFHPLLGFFANTVVLRCDLSGNPNVMTAISRVQAETEAVFEREIPFADIVQAAGVVPDTSLTPLIQAAFMFPKLPPARFGEPGDAARTGADVTVEARIDGSVEGTAKFDLSLTMEETDDGIDGSIEYATALFGADAIQHIGEHFLVLLESMTKNPAEPVGRLRLMTQDEQRKLLAEWSNPGWPGTEPTASSVERQPPSLLAM